VQNVLLDSLNDFGFTQFVNLPTRGVNVLVCYNKPLFINSLNSHGPVGNSDHGSIEFYVAIEAERYIPINKGHNNNIVTPQYMWDQADYDSMSTYLSSINWQDMVSHNLTPGSLWSIHSMRSAVV